MKSELTALCTVCPSQEEVEADLNQFGFCLVLQLEAVIYPACTKMPTLPAQYHYTDGHGTEVLYLAGPDYPETGGRYPIHASRFWLIAGSYPASAELVRGFLSIKWRLTWQNAMPAHTPQAI